MDGVDAMDRDAAAPITTKGILVMNDRRVVVGGGVEFTIAATVVERHNAAHKATMMQICTTDDRGRSIIRFGGVLFDVVMLWQCV